MIMDVPVQRLSRLASGLMKSVYCLGVLWGVGTIALPAELHAQDNSNNVELFKSIPPAPNAAALAQYGNIPVGFATGIPQIQIPLYNIQVGSEFSMPVSLSYHASGIKVDQRATFVGLGWTLNAGGVITRVIKGNPDEGGYSGPNRHGNLIPTSSMNDQNYHLYEGSALGSFDMQPDEYSYNFNGQSGRFVIDVNGNARLLPYRNIKIERIPTAGLFYFQVTTEDGTKYVFQENETTTSTPCAGEVESNVSSWYLNSILLPQSKQAITFNYENDPPLETQKYSETRKVTPGPCFGAPPVTIRGCISTFATSQLKIKRITFPGGEVNFSYAFQRTDLSNSLNQTFYALSAIDVSSSAVSFVKRYTLDYGYLSGRLSLSAVNEVTSGSSKALTHKMSYAQGVLTGYNSKSQDHWGYYNGAFNTILVPGDGANEGADREPNATHAVIGTLNKLEYPSGGYTQFEYEGNTYSSDVNGQVNEPVLQEATSLISVRTGHPNYPVAKSDSIVFTVNRGGYVQLDITRQVCCGNVVSVEIRNHASGVTNFVSHTTGPYWIPAGTYTIVASAEHAEPTATSEHVSVFLKYKNEIGRAYVSRAGGLRIRKITTFDGIDHGRDFIKTYSYDAVEAGLSSGNLLAKPNYFYVYAHSKDGTDCPQSITTSAANNEIEFASGGVVVYQRVVESLGIAGENGSVRYFYDLPFPMASIGFPFTPSPIVQGSDPLLLRKETLNKNGLLVEELVNEYTTIYRDTVLGWKAGFTKRIFELEMPSVSERLRNIFSSSRYRYISSVVLPAKERRRQFALDGTVMSDSTMYFYDNSQHIQPTRIRTSTSTGSDLVMHKKYITDFTLPVSGSLSGPLEAIRFMQDEHRHSFVVEQYTQQVKQGVASTISGSVITYKKLPAATGFNALMDSVYTLDVVAPLADFSPLMMDQGYLRKDLRYRPGLAFHMYDNKGNILQQSKANDVNEVILWGYNRLYPVAKVAGSNYNTVAAFVDQNILDAPADENQLRTELNKVRSGLAGTKAEVSTYTYKPMVGMTSVTDPKNVTTYYEYDELGRLRVVRDKDNKIIKMICYDINGQVYDCGGRSAQ